MYLDGDGVYMRKNDGDKYIFIAVRLILDGFLS
jgi:hypothetical protein